jgi:hypothetical protein
MEYSTLEFSCLQNQCGRFVEVCEYHGGAQRGGLRVPEGYLGKGWNRFAEELASFFLGKKSPVELRDGKSHNGKMVARDSRDFAARIKPLVGSLFPFKSSDLNLNQKPLDLVAPRPTRMFFFKWEPIHQTLHITKPMGERRQAHWVGLKHKAHGLALSTARAFPLAQDLVIGSGHLNSDPSPTETILEPSSSCPVDSILGKEVDSSSKLAKSSSDEIEDPVDSILGKELDSPNELAESSSDELEDEIQSIIEVSEMAMVCAQEDPAPSPVVWVDLALLARGSPVNSGLGTFPLLSNTVYEVGEPSHFVSEGSTPSSR